MELVNEFSVNCPIAETWRILTDVKRIVPCLPGAQLEHIDGEFYHATVKLKVGPISASFRGKANFVTRDPEKYFLELAAAGSDTGGKGSAAATVTAQLAEVSEGVTHCVVNTDLSITGKVAQFGRGAMTDISSKMIGQFATNLNSVLEAEVDSKLNSEPISAGGPVAEVGSTRAGRGGLREAVRPAPVAEPLDLLDRSWSTLLADRRLHGAVVLLLMVGVAVLVGRSRPVGPNT